MRDWVREDPDGELDPLAIPSEGAEGWEGVSVNFFDPVLLFQTVVVECLSVFQFLHSLGSFLMIDGQAQRDLVNMMEALVKRFGARARLSTQVGLLMAQGAMPGPDSFKEWWEARTGSAQLSAPSGPKIAWRDAWACPVSWGESPRDW